MINYVQLKQEEKEIVEKFKNFLNEVLSSYENYFREILLKKDSEHLFEEVIEYDKKNDVVARDILDDCLWFIQKNEPRANHLRLIISIVNSLNDIKRISNYLVTMVKFYHKSIDQFDIESVAIFKELGELTVETSNNLLSIINVFDLKNMKKEAKVLFNDYIERYKNLYYVSINDTIQKKNSVKFITRSILVFKNFDRTIDHLMNIIDNISNI